MIFKVQRKAYFVYLAITFFSMLLGTPAMAQNSDDTKMKKTLTTESELAGDARELIERFWQTGLFQFFRGVKEAKIEYAAFTHEKDADCLIISPGRSEGYLKYQELAYDLFNQGLNIVIIDHRGQGLSERLLADPHKGHVDNFNDYVLDLQTLVSSIAPQYCQGKKYLLAHSMGGAIAARYLQQFPYDFDAAVLASPMIAINSGGLPKQVASIAIKGLNFINQLTSDDVWYMPGHGGYQARDFDDNQLTHSSLRYEIFSNLYQQTSALQLGGVTLNWLVEAINVERDILDNVDKIITPTLVLQAGADSVVDNQGQNEFCLRLQAAGKGSCPKGEPEVFEGAWHELFFEQDSHRSAALSLAIDWYNKH